jgi:hypothetical protein
VDCAGGLRQRLGSAPHRFGRDGERRHDTGDRVAEILCVLLHRRLPASIGRLRGLLPGGEPIAFLQGIAQLVHGARQGADLVTAVCLTQLEVVIAPGELIQHL